MFGRRVKPVEHFQLQPLAIESRKRKITAPEDVVDLPPRVRKRHPVPEVDGISFYRTISKQRVAPGTEISDSEDEADTFWVLQSQRRDQTQLGVSQVAQDFNELLNRHLDEETPLSDSFTRDAIVRFARKFKSQLAAEGWRDEFEKKLRQLESKKVVNEDTVRYCLELLPSVDENRPQTPNDGVDMSQEEEDDARRALNEQLGVSSPSPASRRTNSMPLGRRDILCNRPGTAKTSGLIPIEELIFDNIERRARGKMAVDAIRPMDVDYEKLVQILDHDLGLRRDIDHIVCTGVENETYCPIVDQSDLQKALSEHVSVESPGAIVFELHDQTSFERGLEQNGDRTPRAARRTTQEIRKTPLTVGKRVTMKKKKKECICGVELEGMRGAFSCGNPQCWRSFHLTCLNMNRRPPGMWLCEDCSK
jgi:hypothetical protein